MFSIVILIVAFFACLQSFVLSAPIPSQGIQKRETGQATYFYLGVGNCGDDDTGKDSDFIVALDSTTYGSGEYCNTYVSITDTTTGETQKGLVRDSCPSCSVGSIDMSTGLFTALHGSTDAGVFAISWEFASDDSSS
ncbi:RlpA-like double-psi beta-barrel-protein domain-containing protein-containing protein [Armillaria luteobubalina]|uniref:RlpA-like double-psi beta-barrel-protein domain-containing protein-containing protein n=1 Tax=Armillaria luteobubalina TaxID=153913 RepID=A0AA39PHG9_9AGAR|nr:RlpA-like double-psi beta-barrel-protein domain-containing protein-containing protein [Armillaria luteobubalina]